MLTYWESVQAEELQHLQSNLFYFPNHHFNLGINFFTVSAQFFSFLQGIEWYEK